MTMKNSPENKEPFFDWNKVKRRFIPEGRILLYCLFFGLAAAPALAFAIFHFMGTVPGGYTITLFYRDVRRDLFDGVGIAWALVLSPYFILQVFRIVRWSVSSLKDSLSNS